MNPRIQINKRKSGWGNVSYDVYVDSAFIRNYRTKKEAKEMGEKKIVTKKEQEDQLAEYINDLANDEVT